jgi:hypothetical protein
MPESLEQGTVSCACVHPCIAAGGREGGRAAHNLCLMRVEWCRCARRERVRALERQWRATATVSLCCGALCPSASVRVPEEEIGLSDCESDGAHRNQPRPVSTDPLATSCIVYGAYCIAIAQNPLFYHNAAAHPIGRVVRLSVPLFAIIRTFPCSPLCLHRAQGG